MHHRLVPAWDPVGKQITTTTTSIPSGQLLGQQQAGVAASSTSPYLDDMSILEHNSEPNSNNSSGGTLGEPNMTGLNEHPDVVSNVLLLSKDTRSVTGEPTELIRVDVNGTHLSR